MSIMSRIIHFVGGIFFERPVRGMTAEALRAKLSTSQSTFLATLRDKSDSVANKELLAHIISSNDGHRRASSKHTPALSSPKNTTTTAPLRIPAM